MVGQSPLLRASTPDVKFDQLLEKALRATRSRQHRNKDFPKWIRRRDSGLVGTR